MSILAGTDLIKRKGRYADADVVLALLEGMSKARRDSGNHKALLQ